MLVVYEFVMHVSVYMFMMHALLCSWFSCMRSWCLVGIVMHGNWIMTKMMLIYFYDYDYILYDYDLELYDYISYI